jgi:hypothetical protein
MPDDITDKLISPLRINAIDIDLAQEYCPL